MPCPAPVPGDVPAHADGWISITKEGGTGTPHLAELLTELPQDEAAPIRSCIRLTWMRPEVQEWLQLYAAIVGGVVAPPSWHPPAYVRCMSAIRSQVQALESARIKGARK